MNKGVKMKRLTILFFLILFIISGCSLYNKSNSKSVNAEIRDIFLPSKISFRGDVEYGNDLIYGTVFRSNLIKIFFYDLKGNLKNKLQIKRGKGPGKAVNVRESLIKNDKLYLFDSSQNKIIIYSISGEHIKDINIDIDDVIIDFELSKKYYYFEGLLNYKLI